MVVCGVLYFNAHGAGALTAAYGGSLAELNYVLQL